jgi:hypothetical protein
LAEFIISNGGLIGIVIRSAEGASGSTFFTPDDLSLQLGVLRHPAGRIIEAHAHPERSRSVYKTQEALIVRAGILRVDFYDSLGEYLHSRVLKNGDIVLLADGCHGFEVLEEVDLVELKLGPYNEDSDKLSINSVDPSRVRLLGPEIPEVGE